MKLAYSKYTTLTMLSNTKDLFAVAKLARSAVPCKSPTKTSTSKSLTDINPPSLVAVNNTEQPSLFDSDDGTSSLFNSRPLASSSLIGSANASQHDGKSENTEEVVDEQNVTNPVQQDSPLSLDNLENSLAHALKLVAQVKSVQHLANNEVLLEQDLQTARAEVALLAQQLEDAQRAVHDREQALQALRQSNAARKSALRELTNACKNVAHISQAIHLE